MERNPSGQTPATVGASITPGNVAADCLCARCTFPTAKRRRHQPPPAQLLADFCLEAAAAAGEMVALSDRLHFLLERLAHIRCFSLSVSAAGGALLVHADVSAVGTIVTLRCRLSVPALCSDARPEHTDCCLRLDVGEDLDGDASCTVEAGYAYVRLPLAAERARCAGRAQLPLSELATASTAALDDGRASQQLREEAGLYHRAAEQRRHERAALAGAVLSCRRCAAPPLVDVADARALPDADLSSLVDFMQCCEDLHFDWRCVFPPEAPSTVPTEVAAADDEAARAADRIAALEAMDTSAPALVSGGSGCFLGNHALHLPAPPDPHQLAVRVAVSRAFAEPTCYRHTTGRASAPLWAPLQCTQCEATLGAARLGSEATSTLGGRCGASPVWFDERAPPEVDCGWQLLKGAVRCTSIGASGRAGDHGDSVGGAGGIGGAGDAGSGDPLKRYSMGAVLSNRILRAAEDEAGKPARRFIIVGDEMAAPELLIVLLSPYVTLTTNQSAAAARGRPSTTVTDALKVLYACGDALATAQAAFGTEAAVRLLLPEADERAAVLEALQASTAMLPPAARRVGALQVGCLPVAPTWD